MDLGIAGKVALVTGAAGGLGEAMTARLLEEGVNVVIADISREKVDAAAERLAIDAARYLPVPVDITNEASVAEMMVEVAHRFGGVDILVNNAGFTRDMRLTKMAVEDFTSVIDVTLKGSFLCTRAVLPGMIEKRWGRIINISSRAHLGNPGQGNYSAAKAGLIGFTRAMSLENGRHGITVNAIAPGVIGTEAVRNLPHFEKIRSNSEATTPVPRIGEPADIADAVAFIASTRAGYISGEVLHVSGGRY